MNSIYTFALLLLSFISHAQIPNSAYQVLPVDSVSHKIIYTAVVQAPKATKDELFTRAREWAARSIVDSKAAARVEDKEAGSLIFQSGFDLAGPSDSYSFTVAIYTKDSRYKYSIDQITRTWGVRSDGRWVAGPTTKPLEYFGTVKLNKGQQGEMSSFDQKIKGIISSIEQAMSKKVAASDF